MKTADCIWVHDRDWFLTATPGQKCRHPKCPNQAVAQLLRKGRKRTQYYGYCQDHMYGRRINGDRVEVSVHPESRCVAKGFFSLVAEPQ